MPIRALVFDLDGTLLESADIKTKAFAQLFENFPEQVESIVEYHVTHAGVSRFEKFRVIYRDIIKRPLSVDEERRLGETYRRLVKDEVVKCPAVRGAEAFLAAISGRYECFIASGTPQEELEEIVTARGLRPFFHEVFGSPAAKPDILRKIVRRMGQEPRAVLAIGDALSDQQAAEEVRVPFVGRVAPGQPNRFPPGSTIAVIEHFERLLLDWPQLESRIV
jgi:phosphoglycolate phosphatase-like HAD superfamily hydrolase